jgi:hypothetical protein
MRLQQRIWCALVAVAAIVRFSNHSLVHKHNQAEGSARRHVQRRSCASARRCRRLCHGACVVVGHLRAANNGCGVTNVHVHVHTSAVLSGSADERHSVYMHDPCTCLELSPARRGRNLTEGSCAATVRAAVQGRSRRAVTFVS